METLSFTFGVLSVVAVILMSVIVLGIVKVLKLQQQIKDLEGNLSHTHSQIFDGDKNVHHRIEKDVEQLHRRIDDAHSYIDSRIDKLTASKQLIKS